MVAGVSVVLVLALAVPVEDGVGGLGEGSTLEAVACPVLLTVMLAWNVWPALIRAGSVRAVTASDGGVCTCARLVEVALAVTVPAPSFPVAAPVRTSVPVPVPFSR